MIQKRLQHGPFWLPFGSFLTIFFDMFVDVFFCIAFFTFFVTFGSHLGTFGGSLGTKVVGISGGKLDFVEGPVWGSILGRFGEHFGRIEDFGDIWGWILACGLLAVCLLLAMVCFWFACVLRFCYVPCVPWCPLVFPRVPCVSFFCALPVPMPRQVSKS